MSDAPEHVDKTAAGHVCRHCGGSVDEDGFSIGGLVTDTGEFEPIEGDDEEQETEQHESGEKSRALAFADAVRRSRR
jgi:hypothetical protein